MIEKLKQRQEQKRMENQKRMQEAAARKEEEMKLVSDIAYAQEELNQLRKEYGLEKEEKGLKKLITRYLDKREERTRVPVNKKKYIWLCLLGAFGAHRFYSKRYGLGVLYLLLCWSGLSISMTIIDWMIVAPMKADENGNVYL